MKKLFVALLSFLLIAAFYPAVSESATPCPPEVNQAKELLAKRQVAKTTAEPQAPRALAGAKKPEMQAPRGQDVQAPRGQDVQAPRGQDIQAPRALAGAKAKTPNIAKARTLVEEAEAACKAGKTTLAMEKAKAAIEILK
jgi:hypothetical protein